MLMAEYGLFVLLGVVGAIFANSTGAGGGVVFVPFFSQLEFTTTTTVATSFAIQCCGMTAGAITWWAYFRKQHDNGDDWLEMREGLWLSAPFSVLGIWLGQYQQYLAGAVGDANALHIGFGIFSIILALAIFATIPIIKQQKFEAEFVRLDRIAIPIVSLIGGVITAWLSIGIGELLAVYLIMRGFNVTFAIAIAVILSAISVWGGVLYHAFISGGIYWPVVMFAGIGAVMGGIVAKYLTLFFSPAKLKIFFAGWILILGVGSLPF